MCFFIKCFLFHNLNKIKSAFLASAFIILCFQKKFHSLISKLKTYRNPRYAKGSDDVKAFLAGTSQFKIDEIEVYRVEFNA